MSLPTSNWVSKIPFVRLLISLVAGIGLQWQLQVEIVWLVISFAVSMCVIVFYSLLQVSIKYRFAFLSGSVITVILVVSGAILVWVNDIRHDATWIGDQYKAGDFLVAVMEEPLTEKTNSYKAQAKVISVVNKDNKVNVRGNIILYFKKDSSLKHLHYGSKIIFNKSLQEIRNNGNPGGFDYKRYCLFQGITHQVYLTEKDFVLLQDENKSWFKTFIFDCKDWVITTLTKFIRGDKERGLAEALLIGYKNDLDKDLVQSYSNTGVVHVIAISGLHLGLIYWLLLLLTAPLNNKRMVWLRLIIILASLWLFSILAGAQPSVLRSAVMFSFIALGEVLERKASVYNTLALSAFTLLCYNPYWLWDVGFQLSYAAVLSILIFFRPIYNWFFFRNKLLDFVWKLNAVTIAAQLLTLPVSIYHFHQVPTLFIFTNLVAVPLSSIILIAEILLCVVFFNEPVAYILGAIIKWMIWCMNSYIERWDNVSFSIWSQLSVSGIQAILLTVTIISFCFWIMEKKKLLTWLSLYSLLCILVLRSLSFLDADQQRKLVVYNVPRYSAIDLIESRKAAFIGDTELINNEFLKNFHLQPSRIADRIVSITSTGLKDFEFCNRHILIVDSSFNLRSYNAKVRVDLVILSGNSKFYVPAFVKNFSTRQIVIDSSVPAWKSKRWKKDCDSLHIPCHNVSDEGAFVMNL